MRPGVLASLLLLSACGCACEADGGTRDAGRPPATSTRHAPPAEEPLVRDWLLAQAISTTRFAAPVLWVWVTTDELERVRAGESVATLPTAPEGSLDEALEGDGSELAAALRSGTLAGRRRAWPSPWASRLGWPGHEPEGDHLVRVELRPESLIVVYDARHSPPRVAFATERGTPAPSGEALHVPELWAAVLLIHEVRDDSGTPVLSREYVLTSPAMIGRVSVGSVEIENELRTERTRLLRVARNLGDDVRISMTPGLLERLWETIPGDDATTRDAWASVLTSGARYPLAAIPIVRLVRQLGDDAAPFEWQTSLPSEPRPHFFDR